MHSNFIIIFSPLLMFVAEREQLLDFQCCRSRFGLIRFPNETVSFAPDDLLALRSLSSLVRSDSSICSRMCVCVSKLKVRHHIALQRDTDIICSIFFFISAPVPFTSDFDFPAMIISQVAHAFVFAYACECAYLCSTY